VLTLTPAFSLSLSALSLTSCSFKKCNPRTIDLCVSFTHSNVGELWGEGIELIREEGLGNIPKMELLLALACYL
jgi:hypothetical protein